MKYQKKIYLLSLAMCSVSCGVMQAGDFNQTLDQLWRTSATVRGLEARTEAYIAELSTRSNLPDPEIEGEYLRGTDASNRWNVGISWSLDWPGVYAARGKEAEMMSTAHQLQLESNARRLRVELAQLLADYLKSMRRMSLLHSISEANDSIAAIVEAGIRHGHLTALDSYKINIEKGRLLASLQQEESSCASARTAILEAYGAGAGDILDQLTPSFPPLQSQTKEYYLSRVDGAPDTQVADMEVLIARQSRKVMGAEALPSLSVGYAHAFEEDTHFNGATLGLSIPIFSSKGKKRAAEAAINAASVNADIERENLRIRTGIAADRLSALKQAIEKLAPVFNTESPQQLLLKSYQLGRISLIDYLQERNYYLEAELEFLDLQADATSILAMLESL